jgi:hypothetical protein
VSAAHIYGMQTITVRGRCRGELDTLEQPIRDFAEQFPAIPGWRSVLGLFYTYTGRRADARRELERIAGREWTDWPEDSSWLPSITSSAETCAGVGDRARAAKLYDLLAPYAERNVLVGRVASVCLGSASRYLGLMATTLARWEEAERHFEAGVEMNSRMGARPFVAFTRHEYARMLLARKAHGDSDRAAELLSLALEDAEPLGMAHLTRWIQSDLASLERGEAVGATGGGPAPAPPDVGAEPEPSKPAPTQPAKQASTPRRVLFRRQGEYWTVGAEAEPFALKDSKGLQYLAELLRHPGTERHAADLVARVNPADPEARGQAGPREAAGETALPPASDDAGALLDPQAKAAYRSRVEDLREEIE